MARYVFFSFHHGGDSKRIGVVRNHHITKDDYQEAGYIDSADWEKIKLQGKDATKKWINTQLNGTSVTVVLIGAQTSEREWVNYEIEESFNRGNALLGVYIHNIKGLDQVTTPKGKNPFENFIIDASGKTLGSIVPTYDWVNNDGYNNFSEWVESAYKNWQKPANSILKSIAQSSTPQLTVLPQTPRVLTRDEGEQFIEDFGIKTNLTHTVGLDCEVKQDGFRPFFLKGSGTPLKKKRSLEFFINSCNVPRPYTVKWKVKNTGTEASSLKALRGEITDDAGSGKKKENTLYTGTHYVECYVVKDGYCVAKERINVPISSY